MQAIIGGSGLAQVAELHLKRREVVRTPFGDPSCALSFGVLGDVEVVFLARHGYGHTIAPHDINYRANLWALHHVGVTSIVAVAAVGGIRSDFGPGAIVLPDQIIDYTYGRKSTFFEGPDYPVTHVDFTLPYDEPLRRQLAEAAGSVGEMVTSGATYGCMQGPRLETAAEILRLERDGCDLVGMTGMPEAALARELSVPYATLAVVANHAAGKGDSREEVSMEAIGDVLDSTMVRVRKILVACIGRRGAAVTQGSAGARQP
jgi:5'-methylthioinosine phosphorylase